MNDIGLYLWVGRALAIVLALALLAWSLRRQRQQFAGKLDQVIAALTEKVAALATLVAGIPARVERPAEAPRTAPRREASPVRSYETARRLARSGATVEEIVATCGVAGTEARLLRRLHGADLERDSAA